MVRGLDTGADDWISKPFRRTEFLTRIRCQLGDVDPLEESEDGRWHCPVGWLVGWWHSLLVG